MKQNEQVTRGPSVIILSHCNGGLPIELDMSTEEVIYKDNRVNFYKIKDAYEAGLDRVKLTHNLEYQDMGGLVNFGCLTLTKEKLETLIKSVWKLLKEYNKVGN